MDIIKRSSGFVSVFEKLAFDLITFLLCSRLWPKATYRKKQFIFILQVTGCFWGESGQEHKAWTIAEHCLLDCLPACPLSHYKLAFYTTLALDCSAHNRLGIPTSVICHNSLSQPWPQTSWLGSSSVEVPSF